jgi:YD repeat-containing protein
VYEPGSQTATYSQTTYQLFKNNTITLNGTAIACSNNNPPSATLPCATISADSVVTQLGYNSKGDLTSSSTPDGNGSEAAKTTYSYNGDGNQNSVTSIASSVVCVGGRFVPRLPGGCWARHFRLVPVSSW